MAIVVQHKGIAKRSQFKYFQICKILKTYVQGAYTHGTIPILDMISRGGARIGDYYNILMETRPDDLERTETKWAAKLGDEEVDLDMSLEIAKKVFLSANLKSQHYKTVFSLYYTPTKLYNWGKRENSCCPRCQDSPADIIHMFFGCSKLASLKTDIEKFWFYTTKKTDKYESSINAAWIR